jgi:hypothetical protein
MDIAGKVIVRKSLTANNTQLELDSELGVGTYFLQVNMKDGSVITKKVNKI